MTVNPDPSQDDDYLDPKDYQDDLDTNSNMIDRVTLEEGDDPSELLGVNKKEFAKELDKYDFDDGDGEQEDDDRLNDIEDRDQDS
jgi:hypothetical protein